MSELRRRIEHTVGDLAAAREADDGYLVDIRLGELESLARLAAEHGITVDGVEESLLRHGLGTPSAGVPVIVDIADPRGQKGPVLAAAVSQTPSGDLAVG